MRGVFAEEIHRSQGMSSFSPISNDRLTELRRRFFFPPSTASVATSTMATSPTATSTNNVVKFRKNLFGQLHPSENIKFAHEEMNKMSKVDSQRWNFDFENEKPKEGYYKWQSLPITTTTTATTTTAAVTATPASATSAVPASSSTPTGVPQSSQKSILTCLTSKTVNKVRCPTGVSSNTKAVKRLQERSPKNITNKKLCTDYFKQSKSSKKVSSSKSNLNKEISVNTKNMSKKLSEILKIRSVNVKK